MAEEDGDDDAGLAEPAGEEREAVHRLERHPAYREEEQDEEDSLRRTRFLHADNTADNQTWTGTTISPH